MYASSAMRPDHHTPPEHQQKSPDTTSLRRIASADDILLIPRNITPPPRQGSTLISPINRPTAPENRSTTPENRSTTPENRSATPEHPTRLPSPNFNLLNAVFAPYIETFASANAHSISGLEHAPLDRACLVVMSHSTNTREIATLIKRLHDYKRDLGHPNKLTRMLVDRNLIAFPLGYLFKNILGCLEANPGNFKLLRQSGESIGLCPEGQRGAISRLDTVNWRGRGMALMSMRYNMPVLPITTAGAEALQRDVTDLLGPLKPLVQRPLDFIRDFGYERLAIPILLGLCTPSGPFPAYLIPPIGQAFADKIHSQAGSLIEPKTFIQAFNQSKGCQLTPESAAKIYRENFKDLISLCYRALRSNGAYFNDNTERFAQLLDRLSRADEQPDFISIFNQLPSPLHETADACGKTLAEQLSERLTNRHQLHLFFAFQAIERFNDAVLLSMNSLLRQAQQQLNTTNGTLEEAKRRLLTNTRTLLLTLPLLWLPSFKLHGLMLPAKANVALHGLYLLRVAVELARDAKQILTDTHRPSVRHLRTRPHPEQEKFEATHNKLE